MDWIKQEWCTSDTECKFHKHTESWYRTVIHRQPGDSFMYTAPVCLGCKYHRGINLYQEPEVRE